MKTFKVTLIALLFIAGTVSAQSYTIQSETRTNSSFGVTFHAGDTVCMIRTAAGENYFPSIGMMAYQVPGNLPSGWSYNCGVVYSTQTQTADIGSVVKRFFDDKGQEWNNIAH